MKLTIEDPDGNTIVRYGISDFETTNDGNVVILFYPKRLRDENDAPDEEYIEGDIIAGLDGTNFDDPTLREEDLIYENQKADDIKDYR